MKDELVVWQPKTIGLEAKWLLPFTSLLTPYLIFLNANHYALDTPAPWVTGATLIIFGFVIAILGKIGGNFLGNLLTAVLITIFLDIQLRWIGGKPEFALSILAVLILAWSLKENFYKIVNSVFAVFLLVTLVQVVVREPVAHREELQQSSNLEKQYPLRVIHLVLDEHVGIEGIPLEREAGRAFKKKMLAFYERFGFSVFGGAYSHHGETRDSIPNLLNYSDTGIAGSLVRKMPGGGGWALLKNRYFSDLHSVGYRINVWESKFLSYCLENEHDIDICNTYNHWDIKAMQDFELLLTDQVKVLFFVYIKHSMVYSLSRWYYKKLRTVAGRHGIELPKWSWDRLPSVTALNSLKAMDDVWEDIVSLPEGNVLFAHLMFPHQPFVARPDCTIRKNIDTWLGTHGLDSEAARKEKYGLYFDQVDCLRSKLETLFERMQEERIWEDSLIILQGDHGSRLSTTVPDPDSRDELTGRDLTDYFSTLFAVRWPGRKAVYSTERVPIQDILEAIISGLGSTDGQLRVVESTPFVYLPPQGQDIPLTAIPYTTRQ